MAGTITHKWDGTILTITSDSGTSSCDLKGAKGDMGVRGAQGAAGVLTDASGLVLAPAENYYLKQEVDDAISASAAELNNSIDTLESRVIMNEIEASNTIAAQNKRITNLEHWLAPRYFETDSASAYLKSVPDGALPYAEVTEIGGMTRKCKNLIKNFTSDSSVTSIGVTQSVTADSNKITIQGTSTSSGGRLAFVSVSNITLPAGNYTFSAIATGTYQADTTVYLNNKTDGSVFKGVVLGNKTTFSTDETVELSIGINISSTLGAYDCVVYPMINEGSTALPYEDYYSELKNAPVTEIKSIGENLAKFTDKASTAVSGVTYSVSNNRFIIKGVPKEYVAFGYTRIENALPNKYYLALNGIFENIEIRVALNKNNSTVYYQDIVYTEPLTLDYTDYSYDTVTLTIQRHDNSQMNCDFIFAFVENDTVNTLSIPAGAQAQHGYGWGVNENYYNYIDWDLKRFVRNTGCVDLGTLDWSIASNSRYFATPNSLYSADSTNEMPIAIISADYVPTTGQQFNAYEKAFYISTDGKLAIKDTSYTDAASFKAAMNGVMLYYKLAEPVIIDISTILPEDNFIGVTSGGTVIFENEHGLNVPSEITYQFKESAE